MIHDGDLVKTKDGYYGIVTNVLNRLIFLGNGLEPRMNEEEWSQLQPLPLNTFQSDDEPHSNFEGIQRSMR